MRKDQTLSAFLHERLGDHVVAGDRLKLGEIELVVREAQRGPHLRASAWSSRIPGRISRSRAPCAKLEASDEDLARLPASHGRLGALSDGSVERVADATRELLTAERLRQQFHMRRNVTASARSVLGKAADQDNLGLRVVVEDVLGEVEAAQATRHGDIAEDEMDRRKAPQDVHRLAGIARLHELIAELLEVAHDSRLRTAS